jgi:tripeptide aminopeptidase
VPEIGRELKRRDENRTMKHFLVWVILLSMPLRSSLAAQAPRQAAASEIAKHPQTKSALDWFEPHLSSINEVQIKLAEIPAPSYQEEQRAAAVEALLSAAGLTVHGDKIGNVIGELRGANEKEVVILAAHLDTVFPAGTDVKVRHAGERLSGPGISDNGTGLAALVAIARAMQAAKIKPRRTILFAADVGEEGEGNLRGMRALVDAYRANLKAVIVLDGSGTDHVTTKALASRRLEAAISGPGGHSWSDFGMVNPINALVRGAVRFINTKVGTRPFERAVGMEGGAAGQPAWR